MDERFNKLSMHIGEGSKMPSQPPGSVLSSKEPTHCLTANLNLNYTIIITNIMGSTVLLQVYPIANLYGL